MERVALAEPCWYAVHTMAGCETRADKNLARSGFWTWYPFDRYRRKRKKPGGREIVEWTERPHFSRYIFVCLRFENEAIGSVNDMDGVARVVCERYSQRPLTIPNRVMDALMNLALVNLEHEEYPTRHAALMREIAFEGDFNLIMLVNRLGVRQIRRDQKPAPRGTNSHMRQKLLAS